MANLSQLQTQNTSAHAAAGYRNGNEALGMLGTPSAPPGSMWVIMEEPMAMALIRCDNPGDCCPGGSVPVPEWWPSAN